MRPSTENRMVQTVNDSEICPLKDTLPSSCFLPFPLPYPESPSPYTTCGIKASTPLITVEKGEAETVLQARKHHFFFLFGIGEDVRNEMALKRAPRKTKMSSLEARVS